MATTRTESKEPILEERHTIRVFFYGEWALNIGNRLEPFPACLESTYSHIADNSAHFHRQKVMDPSAPINWLITCVTPGNLHEPLLPLLQGRLQAADVVFLCPPHSQTTNSLAATEEKFNTFKERLGITALKKSLFVARWEDCPTDNQKTTLKTRFVAPLLRSDKKTLPTEYSVFLHDLKSICLRFLAEKELRTFALAEHPRGATSTAHSGFFHHKNYAPILMPKIFSFLHKSNFKERIAEAPEDATMEASSSSSLRL